MIININLFIYLNIILLNILFAILVYNLLKITWIYINMQKIISMVRDYCFIKLNKDIDQLSEWNPTVVLDKIFKVDRLEVYKFKNSFYINNFLDFLNPLLYFNIKQYVENNKEIIYD